MHEVQREVVVMLNRGYLLGCLKARGTNILLILLFFIPSTHLKNNEQIRESENSLSKPCMVVSSHTVYSRKHPVMLLVVSTFLTRQMTRIILVSFRNCHD